MLVCDPQRNPDYERYRDMLYPPLGERLFLVGAQSTLPKPSKLAERGGFEPPVGFYTYGALAKRCFRPLSHLSEAVR